MKKCFAIPVLAAVSLALAPAAWTGESVDMEETQMVENIHWLGHDSFRIDGEITVYTDPFRIPDGKTADIILITHGHYDHCSPEDVAKIQGPETVIVATPDCSKNLSGNVKTVKPGDRLTVLGVDIEAVPAYNTNKKFHPKENGWVGYIFTVGGSRIYLAGDTDRIPEMKEFKCDIALLPVSGTYVMTADEAVQAALDINPGVAVPMHYGAIVGEKKDALEFERALKGKVAVRVMEEVR